MAEGDATVEGSAQASGAAGRPAGAPGSRAGWRLFSPLQVGGVRLRNRIVQTAHGKHFSVAGSDSDRDTRYHLARAAGGAGMLITGHRPVHPTGVVRGATLGYWRGVVRRDRLTTAAVHEQGAAILAQLGHFGSHGSSDGDPDLRVLWSASAVKAGYGAETPKAMEPGDVEELAQGWARSAEVAAEGGFDGVELHFAHNYLVHQFLSPLTNHRDDEFGGALRQRADLARRVLGVVRRRVGDGIVVGVRLGVSDFAPGGYEVEDAAVVAATLASGGGVDYLSASAAGPDKSFEIAPSDREAGWLREQAATVKAAVGELPVLVIGGIDSAELAEDVLARGQGDLVGMTRAQIADPELAAKLRDGRDDEVTHCVRLNQGCISRVLRRLPLSCTVNPVTGREGRFGAGPPPPLDEPGRWVVVGGGPAGARAAAGLAERGHDVVLLERAGALGGQVRLASRTVGRELLGKLVDDLAHGLRRAGVDVRLGREATSEAILRLRPDGIVLATGARATRDGVIAAMPGGPRVGEHADDLVHSGWDVLAGAVLGGERVVVCEDDGSRAAAGVVEHLLDAGKEVLLLSCGTGLFPIMETTLDRGLVCRRLLRKGLRYRLHAWVQEVGRDGLEIVDLYTGHTSSLAGRAHVVFVTPPRADAALYGELRERHPSVHRIGDCVAPRRLDHAIYEGFLAGRELWTAVERYDREGLLEEGEEARQNPINWSVQQ